MKLALPLLLLTLALCCPDANAEVCPALSSEMTSFVMGSVASFHENIKKFGAPAEAMQATLRVKRCVNKLPLFDRLAVDHFLKIVKFECNRQLS
ncbi:secretoglobin family 1D member 2-like [Eptesicus fuscus]|uniref:secretoglobin family 1D member 2-like n=1 Tax=Eptesicus fuscus TaxID=29078 RepID=UPI00240464EB|nr:secretoglobin family 1D member 2-like [Eptesicus fuscus]